MNRLVTALLLVLACVPGPSASTVVPDAGDGALVVEVADGDSFRTDTEEFRLVGINAPERDECFGRESADWLEERIEGKSVHLVRTDIDQFDRTLVLVSLAKSSINREAVASGHALAVSNGLELIDGLEQLESDARESGLGMWGTDICGATGAKADLAIVDIDFNPPGTDLIELVAIENQGIDPVALMGFILRDESSVNRFQFPEYVLDPGSRVVISTGCESTVSTLAWCTSDPVWNNGGDTALLLDPFGRVVSLRRY